MIGVTLAVREPDLPSPLPEKADSGPGQLVLLATGPVGYRSLCQLASLIQGHPEREALASRGLGWDTLAAHREGLICLSSGRRGWIERYLRAGDYDAAQLYAGRLAAIFEENAALALELHTAQDERIATEVLALGRRLGLPTVAVQPVFSLAPADAPKLRLLAAIRANARLGDPVTGESDSEESELEAPDEEGISPRREPSQHERGKPPAGMYSFSTAPPPVIRERFKEQSAANHRHQRRISPLAVPCRSCNPLRPLLSRGRHDRRGRCPLRRLSP